MAVEQVSHRQCLVRVSRRHLHALRRLQLRLPGQGGGARSRADAVHQPRRGTAEGAAAAATSLVHFLVSDEFVGNCNSVPVCTAHQHGRNVDATKHEQRELEPIVPDKELCHGLGRARAHLRGDRPQPLPLLRSRSAPSRRWSGCCARRSATSSTCRRWRSSSSCRRSAPWPARRSRSRAVSRSSKFGTYPSENSISFDVVRDSIFSTSN